MVLMQMWAGSEVEASNVMGKGFPIDKCPPEQFPTLLIFATGSGISPIRSLIESQALQASLCAGLQSGAAEPLQQRARGAWHCQLSSHGRRQISGQM